MTDCREVRGYLYFDFFYTVRSRIAHAPLKAQPTRVGLHDSTYNESKLLVETSHEILVLNGKNLLFILCEMDENLLQR